MRRNLAALSVLAALILAIIPVLSPASASADAAYQRFTASFNGTFDTIITLIGYAPEESVFSEIFAEVQQLFTEYHQLFDGYHTYEGIENLCSVNQKAGTAPVKVDQKLFDFLRWCLEREEEFGSDQVNIAMGSVLQLWHEYREAGINDPFTAQLPPMEKLQEAARHMDVNDLVLDAEAMTVYFSDPLLQLDFGAVAKGYTAQKAADFLAASDMPSFILNAGGNVCAGHRKADTGTLWGIGIQDPDTITGSDLFDTIYAADKAVVTSGDYQRYYMVDGKRYAHLISPDTLMPAEQFRGVTVMADDSGLCDFLSTYLFIADYETGRALVDSLPGVEALWILPDRSVRYTDGMTAYLRSTGAISK